MELPQADLELVHALQIFPRASWTQLGQVLGQHPSTIASRWDRLHAEGKLWITGHMGALSSEGNASFISVQCRPGARQEVIARMCGIPAISTVEEAARAWDVRLTVLASSWEQLMHEVLPAIRADEGIYRTHVSVATGLYAMGNNFRLDSLSPAQQQQLSAMADPGPAPAIAAIPYQHELLRILTSNGRASAAQIAQELGIHPTTAARNLRQLLESRNVVLRCELAQAYSGYPVFCQWHVRVPPNQMQEAVRVLRRYRTLRLCASTTGDANLTFALWLRNPGDIAELESTLQSAVPGLQLLDSDVGVRTHKRMGWMLRADSTTTGIVVGPVRGR